MKKTLLAFAFAASLTGCANLRFAWSASYATDNLAADLQRAKAEK